MNTLMRSLAYYRASIGEWQRRFGWVQGGALWLGIRVRQALPLNDRLTLRIPGLPAPLLLRAGGSDRDCFEQIFVRDELGFDMPHEPRVIIDAGANIGLASLVLAERFPHARLLALEVDDANYRVLQANVAAYPQITPIKRALWHRDGYVKIVNPGAEAWAFRVAEADAADPQAIPAVSVNTLLDSIHADRVDLLKMDIEGAEMELLQAAAEWLPRTGVLAIEIHEHIRPGVTRALEDALRSIAHTRDHRGEYRIFHLRHGPAPAGDARLH